MSHSDIELLIHGIEEHNEDLNVLKLNNNKSIDDEICAEIKKLIKGKTPLSELELNGTSVTDKGLEELISASVKSTVFSKLSLKNCEKI